MLYHTIFGLVASAGRRISQFCSRELDVEADAETTEPRRFPNNISKMSGTTYRSAPFQAKESIVSWINDELEKRRLNADDEAQDRDRELHRAKLTDAKALDLWELLKLKCREDVDEFRRKAGDRPRYIVAYEDRGPESFDIVRTNGATAGVKVNLRLRGYRIEVVHKSPVADSMEYRNEPSHFTFECDGLSVSLSRLGTVTSIPDAANKILKPVLFPSEGWDICLGR
jgi:hypothetical protein